MISRIDPILLFVTDFERALKFYRDVLELRVVSVEAIHEEFATFAVGQTTFAIHGGYRGDKGEGPIHLHFVTDDIHDTVRNLKGKGVRFLGPIERMPWGVEETTFLDPDGNRIDLTGPSGDL